MRALVVDDSVAARHHAGVILAELGFQVWEAEHGEHALGVIRRLGPVELVLLDWNMPYADGLWFLRELRKDPTFRDVLVVMATSNADAESITRALGEGASEYLMKPFTGEEVRGKLEILGFQFGGEA